MKRRGFTLVELLAIIILLAGIFLLVYPKVTEILQKEEDKIDDYNLDTIYSAVEAYINNKKEFPKEVGNEYCISIKTLDEQNLLPFDVSKYMKKAIRIKIGKSGNFYELVDSRRVDSDNKCKSKAAMDKQDKEDIYNAAKEFINSNDNLPKEIGDEYCILITTLYKKHFITFDITKYKNKAVHITIGNPNNTYELVDGKLAGNDYTCKKKDEKDELYEATEEYIEKKDDLPKEDGKEYCVLITTLSEQELVSFDITKYKDKAVRIKLGNPNTYEIIDSKLVGNNNSCKNEKQEIKEAAGEYIEKKDDLPKEEGKEYCVLVTTLSEQELITFDITKYKDKAVRVKIGNPNTYEIIDSKLVGNNNSCKSEKETIEDAAGEYIEKKDNLPKEEGKEYCVLITTLYNQHLIPFDIAKYKDKGVRVIIGKSNNTYEIIDGKLVGDNNTCKSNGTPARVKYNATVRTCRSAGTTYTKTSKTCNSYGGSYSCTRYRCDIKTYSKVTDELQVCKEVFDNYIKSTYKCTKYDNYQWKETYKLCTMNEKGKYVWETGTSEYDGPSDACKKESSFTCNEINVGKYYISACTKLGQDVMWYPVSDDVNASSCTPKDNTCETSSHAGRTKTTCTPTYRYEWKSTYSCAGSGICPPMPEPSYSEVTSCTPNSSCSSSNVGSKPVSCSVASVGWTNLGSFSSSTNQATTDPVCSGTQGAGNTDVDCSRSYSYSWGSTNTEYNVSSCTDNVFSCNSSHSGQTYVSCSPNSSEYRFVDSNEIVYDECNTSSSFTCDAAHEGQKYISSCTKRSD